MLGRRSSTACGSKVSASSPPHQPSLSHLHAAVREQQATSAAVEQVHAVLWCRRPCRARRGVVCLVARAGLVLLLLLELLLLGGRLQLSACPAVHLVPAALLDLVLGDALLPLVLDARKAESLGCRSLGGREAARRRSGGAHHGAPGPSCRTGRQARRHVAGHRRVRLERAAGCWRRRRCADGDRRPGSVRCARGRGRVHLHGRRRRQVLPVGEGPMAQARAARRARRRGQRCGVRHGTRREHERVFGCAGGHGGGARERASAKGRSCGEREVARETK